MIPLGPWPAGATLYIPFDSYDGNGASVTMSGFAVTDIEIYKNGSTTQRASDNGYALLDTDGTDFDGTTGLHGFSIDLSDNSDSGFYAVGGQYWININAVTIDSQTVRFTYTFRIVAAESQAGVPKVDVGYNAGTAITSSSGRQEVNVSHFGGSAGTFSSGRPEVNTTHAAGTAWNSGAIGASTLASDTIAAAKIASNAFTSAKFATGALANGVFGAGAIDAAVLAADTLTAAKIASDVTTELQSGLATLSGQMTMQTTVNSILANTDVATSSRMASYTQPTGFLAATFPATVASTTNITAASGITVSSIGSNVISAAAIAAAAANKLADHFRRRTQANVEASSDGDALDISSLYGLIQQIQKAQMNDPNLDVYQTDGVTLLASLPTASATSSTVITGIGF